MVWAQHWRLAVSLDSSQLNKKNNHKHWIQNLFMWFKELYLNCKVSLQLLEKKRLCRLHAKRALLSISKKETHRFAVFIVRGDLFELQLCNVNDQPLLIWFVLAINKSDDSMLMSPGISSLEHLQRRWSEKSLNPSSVCSFPNNP